VASNYPPSFRRTITNNHFTRKEVWPWAKEPSNFSLSLFLFAIKEVMSATEFTAVGPPVYAPPAGGPPVAAPVAQPYAAPATAPPVPSMGEVLAVRFQELRDQLEMRDDYVHKLALKSDT
jgi:hypothetical protein